MLEGSRAKVETCMTTSVEDTIGEEEEGLSEAFQQHPELGLDLLAILLQAMQIYESGLPHSGQGVILIDRGCHHNFRNPLILGPRG
ncbi:hypothetical protein ACLOJK_034808 [Asimina triloba]